VSLPENHHISPLKLAALNDPQVKASEVQHVYLTEPSAEQISTKFGLEFGNDASNAAINFRASYAGACFQKHCVTV